ncbi:MAG TPA: hypothetical protein VGC74_01735 [Stenotrophomonas sp.]
MEQLYQIARRVSCALGLGLALTGIVQMSLALANTGPYGFTGAFWFGAIISAVAAPLLVWPFWPRQGRWLVAIEMSAFAGVLLWLAFLAKSTQGDMLKLPALVFALLLMIRFGLALRQPAPQ